MGIFVSIPKIIESAACAVVFCALLAPCGLKLLGALQTLGYSGGRTCKWTVKKGNVIYARYGLLAFLCALACAVLGLCFSFAGQYAATVGFLAYPLFFALYLVADKKKALRSPYAFTPRFKRLFAVYTVILLVVTYFSVTLLNYADYVWGNGVFMLVRYAPLAVLPLLMLPLALLANGICSLYEIPHNRKFVKKAQAKLKGSPIKVVGITGSYGKTSVKHILAAILSEKYRTLPTPSSHNTPMGLALTINGADVENYDIFIAEMGARHVGDIAELCEICPPDYSVITGICPQHLESFGSVENIVRAKGEILSYTKNKAIIAPDCAEYFKGENIAIADCASDIVCDCTGCAFTLTLGGKSAKVRTKLLGAHSAQNIALAAKVAFELGMGLEEIAKAVGKLDYIEHRLQLTVNNGVYILDDGYNSNIKGAADALEVLKSFPAAKTVVTPGLVELGVLEESENYNLGAKLVGFDRVILVGDTLITPVKRGYLENGGDAEKLFIKPTLTEAQKALSLKSGDAVLFLNDVPDILR